jgi:D-glycero-alpha-D-manno-heptose 1-phosphate guanylyltransferase
MEAVILAGGYGTRLKNVLTDIPKPMAPAGGKPFLWHLLKWISDYPVDKIVLSTGYKSQVIEDYFGKNFGPVELEYAVEEIPLDTGGGLMNAISHLTGQDFFLINGDTYFPVDLTKLMLFHTERCGLISVALKKMKLFSRYGAVECNDDMIVKFREKRPCLSGLINGGVYVVNRKLLMLSKYPESFSFERDILEKKAGTGDLRGICFNSPFLDIGVPGDLKKAASFLAKTGNS